MNALLSAYILVWQALISLYYACYVGIYYACHEGLTCKSHGTDKWLYGGRQMVNVVVSAYILVWQALISLYYACYVGLYYACYVGLICKSHATDRWLHGERQNGECG